VETDGETVGAVCMCEIWSESTSLEEGSRLQGCCSINGGQDYGLGWDLLPSDCVRTNEKHSDLCSDAPAGGTGSEKEKAGTTLYCWRSAPRGAMQYVSACGSRTG
jgi:hypothetical protein